MKFLKKLKDTELVNVKNFLKEEDGVGVVEMILILVVLIGLVLIFKEQLTSIVNKIFKTISDKASSV
ncbi:Flp1 family type IVb pilin [Lachnobacterium bovis]|uniref:Putative Flagellin, Flp1-like, domain n=1 Tax=Lachnobacterium bovis TaxID=140626 RepID=A0A1H9SVQ9_9FIRM|nr:Flp1 family type IVb pilin [Lachnobacterium bovis]SER88995.1 Putative Flagellin, Flp1-like, domain [Lachnobacterium bovis]